MFNKNLHPEPQIVAASLSVGAKSLEEKEVISIYRQRCLQALHTAFSEAVEKNAGNWLVHIQGQFDIFESAIENAAGNPRKGIKYPDSN